MSNVDFQTPISALTLLEKLKTVDGDGSGLDSDQVDGFDAVDLGGGGSTIPVQETLAVDGFGNIASLSIAPTSVASLVISVNGLRAIQTIDYTVAGTAITWINTDYSLDTADQVLATYLV